jgi:hypothetical protein
VTNEKNASEHLENFSEVVTLLEKNLRYIEALGMDDATLQAYRKVVSHLRSRSPEEIGRIFGGKVAAKRPPKYSDPDLTDEQIGRLNGEQIKRHLAAEKVSRAFLESIAALRFGVTRGTLSTLRSRDALTQKLLTLLEHESTHEAISRAALAKQGNVSTDS